ncbi:DUF4279 domain-containing protein [Kribbella sp. NPDC056861]|uniref:DUF4279 domain-containing protein n=1 Tax=Kribbella sp. NPDC056861 TaxID=3154857 RepID=UPI003424BF3A
MNAFKMYLRVTSRVLLPDEISERLGVEPDTARPIGSTWRPEAPPRPHTSWVRNVETTHPNPRPEDLEPMVLGWGQEFAQALGQLVDTTDATVALDIVQDVNDRKDPQQVGIFSARP